MKRQKLFLMTLCLLILSSILVTGCKKKDEQLDIEFTLGYNDSVKISKGNPFTASIKNNGKEFTGELQIEVNQSPSEALIFAKEFQIPENGEKSIQMVIPVYTIQRKFIVRVVVDGKRIFEKTIDSGSFISPNQPIVGVISDQPDEYRFLNTTNYSNYYGEEDVLDYFYSSGPIEELSPDDNKPELFYFDSFDEMVGLDNLEFFNYLYIGNNSNLKITEKMEEKLLTWVAKGGTLFVESGEDYKRLYSFVPESITNFNPKTIAQIEKTQLFERFDLAKPLSIVSGDIIEIEDAMFYSEVDIPLAVYTNRGQGQIINILFDLTHENLDQWQYKSQVIDELLKRGVNGSSTLFSYIDSSSQYSYEYYDMLRYIPSDKKPPYGIMAILFTLYVFLAGPVLYFILKKRDRRDLMWVGVPALSVLCLLLLYVFGFGTRYTKPIMNAISNIEYVDGNDYISIDSKIAIFNNKQGNMSVSWNPDEKVEITTDPYGYYGPQSTSLKVKGKVLSGNRTTYEVYDSPLWSKIDLSASKVLPISVEDTGEFITFEIEDDMVLMSIYNKTPFDLETAYIQWGTGYLYIGELKAKETIDIEFSMKEIKNDFYDFTSSIMDEYNLYSDQSKMRSNLELYQRLSNNYGGYVQPTKSNFSSILIKGINASSIGYDMIVNNDESEEFNRNIISLKTDIVFASGTELNLPAGFVSPSCKTGRSESELYDHYFENRGLDQSVAYIYGENVIKFIFDIPKYLDIEDMTLLVYPLYSENDFYQKNEFEEMMSIPNVTYEIYNASTESYDELMFINEVFTVDKAKYVDSFNNIIIKIKTENIDETFKDYGLVIEAPEITIQGRAK